MTSLRQPLLDAAGSLATPRVGNKQSASVSSEIISDTANGKNDEPHLFAEIVNKSAYAFAKFKNAEDALNNAKRDVRSKQAERNVFPASLKQATARLDATQRDYDVTKTEFQNNAKQLNNLLYGLTSSLRADIQSDTSRDAETPKPASNTVTSEDVERQCRSLFDRFSRETDVKHTKAIKSLENQVLALKRELQEKEQSQQAHIKRIADEQKEHNNIVTTVIKGNEVQLAHLAQGVETLNEFISQIEVKLQHLDKKQISISARLEQNIQVAKPNVRKEDSNQKELLETLAAKYNELDTTMNQDRAALKISENAFDQIYLRLEKLEGHVNDPSRTEQHDHTLNGIYDRLGRLETKVSDFDDRQTAIVSKIPMITVSDVSEPIISCLGDIEAYLKALSNEISHQSDSTLAAMEEFTRYYKEILVNADTSRVTDYQNLKTQIDNLSSAQNAEPSGRIWETEIFELRRRIEQTAQYHADLTAQIQGFVMATQHLARRFEEYSTDEIVMKINMSMRNLNNKGLATLNNQMQLVLKNLEKMDLLEKRIIACERSDQNGTIDSISSIITATP